MAVLISLFLFTSCYIWKDRSKFAAFSSQWPLAAKKILLKRSREHTKYLSKRPLLSYASTHHHVFLFKASHSTSPTMKPSILPEWDPSPLDFRFLGYDVYNYDIITSDLYRRRYPHLTRVLRCR